MNNHVAIAIHGGAGTILRAFMTPEKEKAYTDGLIEALQAGHKILSSGGSALDAVQAAVRSMEDSPLFNAGRGAVFTHDGLNEQDACVMNGATREVGAVANVRRIASPITLARLVMDKSSHVLLAGVGAEEFAEANGTSFVEPEYFYTEHRWNQLQQVLRREEQADGKEQVQLDHSDDQKMGTVGAVARDAQGNLAAATSTGGMTNKRHGRIGDTPLVGAGTYADNQTCAVSATGIGEHIMRGVLAYDLAALMAYGNMSLTDAANLVVMKKLTQLGGSGGVVAIDHEGNIAMPFNSPGMYHGSVSVHGEMSTGIFRDES